MKKNNTIRTEMQDIIDFNVIFISLSTAMIAIRIFRHVLTYITDRATCFVLFYIHVFKERTIVEHTWYNYFATKLGRNIMRCKEKYGFPLLCITVVGWQLYEVLVKRCPQ